MGLTVLAGPACANPQLGGCIGSATCDYCGVPLPAATDARARLAALTAALEPGTRPARRRLHALIGGLR